MATFHSDAPIPHTLTSLDPEAAPHLRNSSSRATFPSASQTQPTSDSIRGDEPDQDPDEFTWGPSHPCFPHLNPHVPLSSPLYQTTRIIRIKRDWMIVGDLAPTFANLYPEVLDPMIPEEEFRNIVKKINNVLIEAFSPWSARAWVDGFMAVATGWLWEDLGLSKVKSQLKELDDWIEDWNERVGAREGVRIIPLRRTAYMTLDIQIPDPHIGAEPEPIRASQELAPREGDRPQPAGEQTDLQQPLPTLQAPLQV